MSLGYSVAFWKILNKSEKRWPRTALCQVKEHDLGSKLERGNLLTDEGRREEMVTRAVTLSPINSTRRLKRVFRL